MPGVTFLSLVHDGLPDTPVAAHLEIGWLAVPFRPQDAARNQRPHLHAGALNR